MIGLISRPVSLPLIHGLSLREIKLKFFLFCIDVEAGGPEALRQEVAAEMKV